MLVPRNRWTDGGWNTKLPQFLPLAQMVGVNSSNPSPDELQTIFKTVADTKVFAESVKKFVKATGKRESDVRRKLRFINHKLGLMEPIPLRSLTQSDVNPSEFEGVALLPAGTVSWMQLRWDRIRLTEHAGAKFNRIIVLGSTRVCNAKADRRHPYIRGVFPEGREPTELELLKQWVYATGQLDRQYVFSEWPDSDKPLSLEMQLRHLVESGQYATLVGDNPVFVPANPNALYVPLHVRRVLGLDNIWFSQGSARLVTPVSDHWWPEDQDLMTTPSGILRLWVELQANGCITSK